MKGNVSDGQKNLPFVPVLLLAIDSSWVQGVVTDTLGGFSFSKVRPGKYLISTSLIGYDKFWSKPVVVAEANIVFPDIILNPSATTLNEVVVKSQKPVFEQQIDRLVVNVQGSLTSAGNTVLEILQKSPGVVVNRQDNSLSMNGKTGVRIMINGKLMQVPTDVAVQMLDGMNASNVEKIELIHTPPAQYDAEGNAGIIHIVTRKNADLGTNGTIGLMAGARWAEAMGGNINLNHRNKKLAYFLDYTLSRNHNLHILETTRQSTDQPGVQNGNNSHRENTTMQQNLSAGFEWMLTEHTMLNLGFTGYRRNWKLAATTQDHNQVTGDSIVNTKMTINESNIWQSGTATIGLQTKINAKSEIGLSLDYLYYHNDNPSSYDNLSRYEQENVNVVAKIDLKKTTPIRFFIAKADYQYRFSPSFSVETGVKGVISSLDNNVLVQRWSNDKWTIDPAFTSYSNLNEQIGAAYVSTKWQPGKQWQVNSGVRYEYTHTTIGTPTQHALINRKYGYFFPSFFLKRDFGLEKDLQFSYSRRITRPTYNDIAPYVFFWGPSTFSAGNTTLWPAVSDALRAGYHRKQWIISLQYSHVKNEIASLQPEVDQKSNTLTYRSQNLRYLKTLGLTNSYSFNLAPWWTIQSNLTTQYQTAQTTHLQKNTIINLYGLSLNLATILKLTNGFSAEISILYQSKTLSGITQYLPLGALNAGIQKKAGKVGTFTFSVDDILNTNNWRIKTYSPSNNLDANFNYKWHNRFIRLTYTHNLGNTKLRSVKLKSGSEEERGRVSN